VGVGVQHLQGARWCLYSVQRQALRNGLPRDLCDWRQVGYDCRLRWSRHRWRGYIQVSLSIAICFHLFLKVPSWTWDKMRRRLIHVCLTCRHSSYTCFWPLSCKHCAKFYCWLMSFACCRIEEREHLFLKKAYQTCTLCCACRLQNIVSAANPGWTKIFCASRQAMHELPFLFS